MAFWVCLYKKNIKKNFELYTILAFRPTEYLNVGWSLVFFNFN